ncbi:MAG: M48 family metallopeptidase, partial [Candidatus Woesebacteria bacterium]|nr:M48 family metallopeptidase [Candidatus Woesebacteria bacterium]
MKNIYEVRTANKWKSAIIVALFVVFVFLATYIISSVFGYYQGYQPGGLGFFGIALIVSGVSSFFGYFYSDKIVLGISGAHPANSTENKLFSQAVENLCIGAGIPKPKLYVIEDTAPNAFATGRDPDHAVICATTGLLDKLTRTELEGVIAHELSHIKNYDTLLMSVVAVLVGTIALVSDWIMRSFWWRGRDNDDREGSGPLFFIFFIVVLIISPIVATLIQLAISRRREFLADASGALITRYPEGLARALEKISRDPNMMQTASTSTAHLFIENPFRKDRIKGNW